MLFNMHPVQKHISILIVFSIFVQAFSPVLVEAVVNIPAGFSFNKDLRVGQTVDPDVRYLQNILNSDKRTEVASTGTGSDQNLTSYFGEKTKNAVMRFQNLYASEILTPNGLTAATGIVGSKTRAKLNSIRSSSNGALTTPITTNVSTVSSPGSTTSRNAVGNLSGEVYITDLSTYKVLSGQIMSITGRGFDVSNNTVQIGQSVAEGLPSISGGTKIIFNVPTDAKPGFYPVLVYSTKGIGTSSGINLEIGTLSGALTASSTRPVITGVSPRTSSNPLQIVTITGKNFTNSNTVITNLGNIKGIRSAGGTVVTFYLNSLPYYSQAEQKYKGQAINITMSVANEYGTSINQSIMTMTLPAVPGIVNTAQNYQDALRTAQYISDFNASTSASAGIPLAQASSSFATSTAFSTSTSSSTSTSTSTTTATSSTTSTNTSGNTTTTTSGSNTTAQPSQGQSQVFNTNPNSDKILDDSEKDGSAAGIAAALGVTAAVAIAAGAAANAATPPYFGGRTLSTTICTASGIPGTSLVYVLDYAHGMVTIPLMYVPGVSRLNAYYTFLEPGVWTIGGYTLATYPCLVGVYPYVVTVGTAIGVIDFIRGVGSSAVGTK